MGNWAQRISRGRAGWPHMIGIAAALAGCSPSSGAAISEGDRIVQSVLKLQVGNGRPICVDNTTDKAALTIYRTMMAAPAPSRVRLGWSVPRPLRPVNYISPGRLYNDQVRGRRIVLDEPGRALRLSREVQQRLNAAAQKLALTTDSDAIAIRRGWGGPTVSSRWWPLNRVASTCTPLYRFSNPVWRDGISFLTVTADHWGTTYALERRKEGWVPIAQWTPWLY